MWINAFRFSMHVLKKNHFKLMIPAFFLSIFMVFMHAAVSYWFIRHAYFAQPEIFDLFIIVPIFLIVFIVTYIIYKTAYPLLRTYVLYIGWKAINGKTDIAYRDFRLTWKKEGIGEKIRAISMKRFRLQIVSYALLFIVPLFILSIIITISRYWTPTDGIYPLDIFCIYFFIGLFSILSCIPAINGYNLYFFAELNLIQSSPKINHVSRESEKTLGNTTTNQLLSKKSLLKWKIILTIVYFGLVFALVLLLLYCQFNSFENYPAWVLIAKYTNSGFLSFFFFFLLTALFVPFFFQGQLGPYCLGIRWVEVIHSHSTLIQLVFIILLGLLTAFFFLIETLSAVYFYQPHNNSEIVN